MSSISDFLPKPKNITSSNDFSDKYKGNDEDDDSLEENQVTDPMVTALVDRPARKSNALIINKGDNDEIDYSIIAKQGHNSNRKIQTSYNDLIPLRQRTDNGEISLEKPDEQQALATTNATKNAIDSLLRGKIESSKPRSIPKKPGDATYVRYTPGNQMGETSDVKHRQRIIKIVDVAQDPLAPPKFKKTNKIPQRTSPPPPILRSPPRKLTAADQEDWYIPPAISNWKNPKGYTIALDKRLSSSAHGLQEVSVNDNRAKLAEALYAAERSARDEIRDRSAMQKKLAEKENAEKEERLRELARKAREERNAYSEKKSNETRSSKLVDDYGDESESDSEEETEAERRRRQDREERKREAERELRMSRMGAERRVQVLARDQDREISEKVALGVAKPSKPTGEAQFDSRLFNQTNSLTAKYNEDQIYDKSLFSAQEGVQRIYHPQFQSGDDDEQGTMDRINSEHRFEGLGSKHERENNMPAREGPVEFVREKDEYGLDDMIEKTYGLQNEEKDNKRRRKE